MNPVELMRRGVMETFHATAAASRMVGRAVATTRELPLPWTDEGSEAWRQRIAATLRELMDLPERTVNQLDPTSSRGEATEGGPAAGEAAVREAFHRLLERSTHVDDRPGEPGLVDIVAALTPDEARILRHLGTTGPVATLDLFAVSLVGRGATMELPKVCLVGQRAGCVHPERTATYLANLERLGVVRAVGQPVEDAGEYQLLEGTSEYKGRADELRQQATVRPKGRRGQLLLTPLGERLIDVAGLR